MRCTTNISAPQSPRRRRRDEDRVGSPLSREAGLRGDTDGREGKSSTVLDWYHFFFFFFILFLFRNTRSRLVVIPVDKTLGSYLD